MARGQRMQTVQLIDNTIAADPFDGRQEAVKALLEPLEAIGLALTTDEVSFTMAYMGLSESNTLTLPDQNILSRAHMLMERAVPAKKRKSFDLTEYELED